MWYVSQFKTQIFSRVEIRIADSKEVKMIDGLFTLDQLLMNSHSISC